MVPWDKNVAANNFSYSVFPLSCSCHWTCREMLAMFGDKHLCCLQLFWLQGMTEFNSLWSQQDRYKARRLKIFSVNFGVIISVMLCLVGLWSRTHPCCQPLVGWSLVLAVGCLALIAMHWDPPEKGGEHSSFTINTFHWNKHSGLCLTDAWQWTVWLSNSFFSLLYLWGALRPPASCHHP